jgi:hypothetical protein
VGVSDHLRLAQSLRGERTLSGAEATAADFNGDGAVGAADLDALRDWLLERYAPAVVSVTPAPLAHVSFLAEISIQFNKRYHVTAASETGVRLVEAGPDGHIGTADDVAVPGAADLYPPALDFLLAAPASATSGTGPGVYGLSVGAPLADFQGRPMVHFSTKFLVTGGPDGRDSDFDGVSDVDEIVDGTNPLLADTDGDWADDGLEKLSGTDPKSRFSVPGETGAGQFVGSLVVSYQNFPVESGNSLPSDATVVTSFLVSYANLPVEIGNLLPSDAMVVTSLPVSYANLPFEAGNLLPSDAVIVTSLPVSYANLPVESGNVVPAGATLVTSLPVSYANLPVENPPSSAPPRVIVSDLVSYQNNI